MTRTLIWRTADGTELTLNGGADGLKVLRPAVGLEGPPVELATSDRPDAGAVRVARRHAARPILLPLLVNETVYDHELVWKFERGGEIEMTTITDPETDPIGRVRRLTGVEYQSGFEGEWSDAKGGLNGQDWRKVPVAFLALDPYWYDYGLVTVVGSFEADISFSDAGTAFNAAIAFSGSSSGISSGASFSDPTINFNSAVTSFSGGAIFDFPALESPLGVWPTFTIHGPATYFKIVNLRSGDIIESAGEVADGKDLIVITKPGDRAVLLNDADAWDRVTADTSAALSIMPGQLEPLLDELGVSIRDDQGRQIMVQGAQDQLAIIFQGTTTNSYIKIFYEERWLTP